LKASGGDGSNGDKMIKLHSYHINYKKTKQEAAQEHVKNATPLTLRGVF